MELNLMIIGAMVLLMAFGGGYIELLNRLEEKKRERIRKEIWGRL